MSLEQAAIGLQRLFRFIQRFLVDKEGLDFPVVKVADVRDAAPDQVDLFRLHVHRKCIQVHVDLPEPFALGVVRFLLVHETPHAAAGQAAAELRVYRMQILEIQLLVAAQVAINLHILRRRVEKTPIEVLREARPTSLLPSLVVGALFRRPRFPFAAQGTEPHGRRAIVQRTDWPRGMFDVWQVVHEFARIRTHPGQPLPDRIPFVLRTSKTVLVAQLQFRKGVQLRDRGQHTKTILPASTAEDKQRLVVDADLKRHLTLLQRLAFWRVAFAGQRQLRVWLVRCKIGFQTRCGLRIVCVVEWNVSSGNDLLVRQHSDSVRHQVVGRFDDQRESVFAGINKAHQRCELDRRERYQTHRCLFLVLAV